MTPKRLELFHCIDELPRENQVLKNANSLLTQRLLRVEKERDSAFAEYQGQLKRAEKLEKELEVAMSYVRESNEAADLQSQQWSDERADWLDEVDDLKKERDLLELRLEQTENEWQAERAEFKDDTEALRNEVEHEAERTRQWIRSYDVAFAECMRLDAILKEFE